MKNLKNIVMLGSGQGSTIQAFLEYFKQHEKARVVACITDNPQSSIKNLAEKYKVKFFLLKKQDEGDEMLSILNSLQPDLILLAGFLKKIHKKVLIQFPDLILNSHPSLLPKYGGKGFYGRKVHEAHIINKETKSGCTIHVVNERFDEGPILASESLDINPEETVDSLETRVKILEKKVYLQTVEKILNSK